ncbi:MAG: V-type ATPase 116kDa subunit family protein [Oscillospiraceae bacterium]
MITKMKFVNIVGQRDSYDQIVSDYIMDTEIELENPLTALKSTPGFLPTTDINPYEKVLKHFTEVFDYANIDYANIKMHRENFNCDDLSKAIDDFDTEIHSLKNRLEVLQADIGHSQLIEDTLSPIVNANVHIGDLVHMKYLKFRFGRLPITSYEKLETYLRDLPTYFAVMTTDSDYVWGFYFTSHETSKKVDHVFSTLYFERVMIDGSEDGTPAEIIANISARNAADKLEISKLTEKINEVITAKKDELIKAYACIKYYYCLHNIKKYSPHTKNTFYITGWVSDDVAQNLSEKAKNDRNVSIIVNEPKTVSHLTPPTKLKNLKIFKPFEEFVKMYGVPNYNELDPTPLLGIIYTILFGIMFGDVGHGMILAAIGILMMALHKGGFLAKLLLPLGLSSTFFGFVYGSVFGFESAHAIIRPLWYTPFENSETMMNTLIYAVIIGVFIILVCMIFNIINGAKQKNWQKIIFSQNGIAGMLFYILVIVSALAMISGSSAPLTVAGILIGISLVMIFLQEPLGKLVSKKKDWMPAEKGGFLVETFFELFEIVLSFVTNTVSFLRVGAFALNHAGMMSVVVMFMLQLKGGSSIAVAIFGNILVIGLEGLIVGIQVLRLGFYEMFSRFYSGDGREFKPTNK